MRPRGAAHTTGHRGCGPKPSRSTLLGSHDVVLANWAFLTIAKPPVNTILVECVKARHYPKLLPLHKSFQAHRALPSFCSATSCGAAVRDNSRPGVQVRGLETPATADCALEHMAHLPLELLHGWPEVHRGSPPEGLEAADDARKLAVHVGAEIVGLARAGRRPSTGLLRLLMLLLLLQLAYFRHDLIEHSRHTSEQAIERVDSWRVDSWRA
mmetsp:Transcript_45417/g.145730  ORF Transcript_45417/g.145730 Transcript_45417/m.145730 type:complete len:212 (+) Transcript_45417:15-650(+)